MKNRTSSLVCHESVRNRCRMLQSALKNPLSASSIILRACQSQALLASLSLPEEGITALSRNSMYKYANLELTLEHIPNGCEYEGSVGYRYLEWLRCEVKKIAKVNSLDRSQSARERRVQQRLQEMSLQVDELRKHSLGVSKAYFHLFSCIKGLYGDESITATTRQRIVNILNDHDRLYSDLFHEVGTVRPGNLEVLQN